MLSIRFTLLAFGVAGGGVLGGSGVYASAWISRRSFGRYTIRKLSLWTLPTMRCSSTLRVASASSPRSPTGRKRGLRPACARRSGRTELGVESTRSKYGTLPACVTMVAPSATAARTPPEWSKC